MEGKGKIQSALWPLLFMGIIPLSAFGADGQIEIGPTSSPTFSIIIDQPGNYVLTSDLIHSISGRHCLQIDADDVILDLNSHDLTGPEPETRSEGVGIFASGRNNVAVLNGTVQGFLCGIDFSGANNEVKNISVCNNIDSGIKVKFSTITDCTADNMGIHYLATNADDANYEIKKKNKKNSIQSN